MNKVAHTHAFDINQPIAVVFPLFSPEGEKRWVPDWDYTPVLGAVQLSEDDIFLTRTHDHAGADAIWLVKKFDAHAHVVQFYKVEPEQKVGLITVACTALSATQTRTTVTYQYTALSASGEMFIQSFDAAAYVDFINEWQELLERYFLSTPQ